MFQQALQEIDEDEEAALEQQLASLLSTQASNTSPIHTPLT